MLMVYKKLSLWLAWLESKYKSGSTDTSIAAALDDTSVMIVGRIPSIFSLIEIGEEAHCWELKEYMAYES